MNTDTLQDALYDLCAEHAEHWLSDNMTDEDAILWESLVTHFHLEPMEFASHALRKPDELLSSRSLSLAADRTASLRAFDRAADRAADECAYEDLDREHEDTAPLNFHD
jgi:hypothetical protein